MREGGELFGTLSFGTVDIAGDSKFHRPRLLLRYGIRLSLVRQPLELFTNELEGHQGVGALEVALLDAKGCWR